MERHSIEEVFRTIAPSRRRGIPSPATIGVGISGGSGGDLSTSLSQAGAEIAQLRASFQQQESLIKANTQAVQSNTSGLGSHSTASAAGSAVSGVFGGALGFLSPIISGIVGLFRGSESRPASLPVYIPPPPVSIGGILHSDVPADGQPKEGSQAGLPSPSSSRIVSLFGEAGTQTTGPAASPAVYSSLSSIPSGILQSGEKAETEAAGVAYRAGVPSPVSSGVASLFGSIRPDTPLEAQRPIGSAGASQSDEPLSYPPRTPVSSGTLQPDVHADAPPTEVGSSGGFPSHGISEITSIFGGAARQTTGRPYIPPAPVFGAILNPAAQGEARQTAAGSQANQSAPRASAAPYAPQITVNVNAMDSQSFMDRSGDIANAVRQAMLNNHPINGVIADL